MSDAPQPRVRKAEQVFDQFSKQQKSIRSPRSGRVKKSIGVAMRAAQKDDILRVDDRRENLPSLVRPFGHCCVIGQAGNGGARCVIVWVGGTRGAIRMSRLIKHEVAEIDAGIRAASSEIGDG